jgi:hypothetical protein
MQTKAHTCAERSLGMHAKRTGHMAALAEAFTRRCQGSQSPDTLRILKVPVLLHHSVVKLCWRYYPKRMNYGGNGREACSGR